MKKLIKKNCKHQFIFSILLGTECWHIIPHPTKIEKKEVIVPMLKEILKKLYENTSGN